MAKKTNQPSPEEAARNAMREVALKNLRAKPLMDLAAAYLVEQGDFGDSGNSAVDQFVYQPALGKSTNYTDFATGEQRSLIIGPMLESRRGGKRYTGSVDEAQIIEQAAAIQQESLMGVKVSDAMNLIGAKYSGEHEDKYIRELAEGNEEEQNLFKAVIGNYGGNFADDAVSRGLSARVKARIGGLERSLNPSESSE